MRSFSTVTIPVGDGKIVVPKLEHASEVHDETNLNFNIILMEAEDP